LTDFRRTIKNPEEVVIAFYLMKQSGPESFLDYHGFISIRGAQGKLYRNSTGEIIFAIGNCGNNLQVGVFEEK
jgi:hypothetical protein